MPATPEIKAWAEALDKLLQKAATVKTTNNIAQIVAVQKELRAFKENSPDYADALDMQATFAIFDLDLDATEEAVANIKERAAEVYKLTKLISGIAEEAQANASALSGEVVVKAIEAATAAVSSFKKLREELASDKPDEAAIAKEIEKTITAIQGLRNKLEKS